MLFGNMISSRGEWGGALLMELRRGWAAPH